MIAAILQELQQRSARWISTRDDEEAVFSSSEDRIRASHASVPVAGHSIVPQETWFARGRVCASRIAESLFRVFSPSDFRVCGEPRLNTSRLPVSPHRLASIVPVRGKVSSSCGNRVLSGYAESDPQGLRRCPVCRRVTRPFDRALAYGSDESRLRELIHPLQYNAVRPAAKILGRMLAEALTRLAPAFERVTFEPPILVIPVPPYKTKRRQRGCNLAQLIARSVLKVHPASAGLQFAPDLLLRTEPEPRNCGLRRSRGARNWHLITGNSGRVGMMMKMPVNMLTDEQDEEQKLIVAHAAGG